MEQHEEGQPSGAEGQGQPAWLKRYADLTLDAAVEAARAESRRFRIIQPGSDVTLDWVPARLNLWMGLDGNIDHVDAG